MVNARRDRRGKHFRGIRTVEGIAGEMIRRCCIGRFEAGGSCTDQGTDYGFYEARRRDSSATAKQEETENVFSIVYRLSLWSEMFYAPDDSLSICVARFLGRKEIEGVALHW